MPIHKHDFIHLFFFFNDTATTEIYTLSLHDALPIRRGRVRTRGAGGARRRAGGRPRSRSEEHTSELQSQSNLVCRLLLDKKKRHYLGKGVLQAVANVNGEIANALRGKPADQRAIDQHFIFIDRAPTESYTLSLHDALPI